MTRREERRRRLAAYRDMLQRTLLPEELAPRLRDVLQAETARPQAGGDAPLDHGSLWGDSPRQQRLF